MIKVAIDCQLTYKVTENTEFIFEIEVAHHPWQTILNETLNIHPKGNIRHFNRDHDLNRLIRITAQQGQLALNYKAEVKLHIPPRDQTLVENEIVNLPSDTLFYLAPSRFCESDLIAGMSQRTFGEISKGYHRVQAICDWIYENVIYESGSSDNTTTARDILVNRAGVCRDFAHLGIAICRSLNIPARFVFGYMPFYTAQPDFHAIFEAYLGDQWVLFDATKMGPIDQFVRVGTGLDAKDVPFSTFYGAVELIDIQPKIHQLIK
ncbi:transglutaminase-like domain-containing protein [Acinetobacter puyangensis]|uniref:transglutaminase-like domain-containing protein n=1 Tax=Acinetobacter puyangensis TaxID=1096779 RepID=UPI003A4D5153